MVNNEEGKINEAHCFKNILTIKGEILKTKIQPYLFLKMSQILVWILQIPQM